MPLYFGLYVPRFLAFFKFCTNGNRKEYYTIYLLNGLMTS